MSVTQTKSSKTKYLHLKIKEDKYNFFVELVSNFGFVKIEYDKENEKRNVIKNIQKGFIDKKAIDRNELKTFPIEELFDER